MAEETAVNEVLFAVMSGKLTVDEAEAWGQRNGHSFTTLAADATDQFANPFWTMEQAAGWIAWRDRAKAAYAAARLRSWGPTRIRSPLADGQHVDMLDAERLLWNAIQGGKVKATGLKVDTSYQPKHTLHRAEIPGADLIDLHWLGGNGLSTTVLSAHLKWVDVYVTAADVCAEWSVNEAIAPKAGSRSEADDRVPPPNRGGAPVQRSWNRMWIEVCRVVHEEGLPESKVALRKRLQNWFAEQGLDVPTDQTMNQTLGDIMDVLNQP